MFGKFCLLLSLLGLSISATLADHVIVSGGVCLRRWEDLRVKQDQHDRWWANFIRAGTVRIDELRKAYGPSAKVVWIVHRSSYEDRGREDNRPYTTWIKEQADKRKVELIWFNTSGEFIRALNNRPRGSVQSFDYFGHSNKYAFMFDYSGEILGASTSWLHERDLPRIKGSIFAKNADCTSWGCHTGESMTAVWKRTVGTPLAGVRGPTQYAPVGHGHMPLAQGPWAR